MPAESGSSVWSNGSTQGSSSAYAPPAYCFDAIPGSTATSIAAGGQPRLRSNKKPTIAEADAEPWSRGYPKFCKWLASDDDFFLVRRFGSTSARIALYLQDEIVELEDKLKAEDKKAIEQGLDSGTFRNDALPDRAKILDLLADRVGRYQNFLLNHIELKSRPSATPFQVNNVQQWLKNANNPIADEEVACFKEEDDLIPVGSTPHSPIKRLLNNWAPSFLQDWKKNARLFTPTEDFEAETTVYNYDRLLDTISTIITTSLVIILAMCVTGVIAVTPFALYFEYTNVRNGG